MICYDGFSVLISRGVFVSLASVIMGTMVMMPSGNVNVTVVS